MDVLLLSLLTASAAHCRFIRSESNQFLVFLNWGSNMSHRAEKSDVEVGRWAKQSFTKRLICTPALVAAGILCATAAGVGTGVGLYAKTFKSTVSYVNGFKPPYSPTYTLPYSG